MVIIVSFGAWLALDRMCRIGLPEVTITITRRSEQEDVVLEQLYLHGHQERTQ